MRYLQLMRTTIAIDDALLERSKAEALRKKQSLGEYIEDSLRQRLSLRKAAEKTAVGLVTFGEGGPMPGVDLDDSASLLERMERT
jgi:hypothetical protein